MSTSTEINRRYTFREFELDVDRGALTKDGVEISLRPQSYAVLKLLVARHGKLVTKDELHAEVWGSKIVTDDSLAHCLIDIRKALGDSARKIIRTVPRRGYVFDAKVVIGGEDSQGLRPTTVWPAKRIAAIASLVIVVLVLWQWNNGGFRLGPAPPQRSIAVLPFNDMSQSQDQQYLGDGLSEDLITSLAQNMDLLVIARTSSFSFAGETPDIETIRNRLNVAYVLEGSVRRSGDSLRITAQLIETSDSSHVWSEAFEEQSEGLPAVQKEIVEQVLQHVLQDNSQRVANQPTPSMPASELMWLARKYEQEVRELPDVDEELLKKSIRLYRDATIADPDSALAHSRLAGALLYANQVNEAEVPISRARALNPDLSEVQTTLGNYYWHRGFGGAGDAWERAITLNPNNADALNSYGYWYWMQGNREGPQDYFQRALELDPLSLSRFAALGNYYAHEAKIDETLAMIGRVEQSFDSPASYRLIARMLELIGRVEESIAWTIKARNLEPENSIHTSALAELYADIGDTETVLRLEPDPGVGLLIKMQRYDEFIEAAELLMIQEPGDIYLRYLLAFAYNATGKPADAVRILRTTGLPDTVMPEARQAIDVEAFVTYVDALDDAGETELSRELATWWINRSHTENASWWIHTYMACTAAVLGRKEEVLARFDKVAESPRLPWRYLISDSHCFQEFRDEPQYKALLQRIDDQSAEIRERLPAVLEDFGVTP